MTRSEPLALRAAPRSLDEVVGQEHILGPGKPLRSLIERGKLRAAVFFGPPGVGKTTVANIVAKNFGWRVVKLNASEATPKEFVSAIRAAEQSRGLLFVDEIHRFDRRSQEVLLAALERGLLTFIGSTVQNPAFALSKALLSRVLLFEFRELKKEDILRILSRAARIAGAELPPESAELIAAASEGDARRAINYLEAAIAAGSLKPEAVRELLGGRWLKFDKTGDEHYDLISALIKSMRASEPDAAAYWLVRLLEAGEDPLFILRRLLIFAAEDVGLKDPRALQVAAAAAQAFERVGRPEGDLILMEAVLYMALAPKSRAVINTLKRARELLEKGEVYPVPASIRDSHYALAKRLGRGVGPKEFLPKELKGIKIYEGGEEE